MIVVVVVVVVGKMMTILSWRVIVAWYNEKPISEANTRSLFHAQ